MRAYNVSEFQFSVIFQPSLIITCQQGYKTGILIAKTFLKIKVFVYKEIIAASNRCQRTIL